LETSSGCEKVARSNNILGNTGAKNVKGNAMTEPRMIPLIHNTVSIVLMQKYGDHTHERSCMAASSNSLVFFAPSSAGMASQSSMVRILLRPVHRRGRSQRYKDLDRMLDVDNIGLDYIYVSGLDVL
jgi:hypothetical protein